MFQNLHLLSGHVHVLLEANKRFISNKKLLINGLFLNRILVGAPLADNLQPNTSRSGGLYRCDIPEPGTIYDNYCQQVPTDGRRCTYAISIREKDDNDISEQINTKTL